MLTTMLLLTLGCGSERWAIKIAADPDAQQIDLLHPVAATVERLRGIPVPSMWSPDMGRLEPEHILYEVHAAVVAYKLEADKDLHIVLRDEFNETMIAEIPDPSCVPDGTPLKPAIAAARIAFLNLVGIRATAKLRTLRMPMPVVIRGVFFVDKIHGQDGVAPNGAELHPVTLVSRDLGDADDAGIP